MNDTSLCVVGLGYVGLPLAAAFAAKYRVVGFDVDPQRVRELSGGFDRTGELTSGALKEIAGSFRCSSDIDDIRDCTVYIVTVPTPVDIHKNPDLGPLRRASESIGNVLKKGDLVVYESTVYPGCTEEECAPILESRSTLVLNRDFHCGYSPERINPGDREHTVRSIRKVTSGSTPEAAERVDRLYASVIEAGTYKASSIKVAEAAKVIENSQRDINIAFVNELSLIFRRMGLDTTEVLDAAGTKWNFLPFRPGLVGGHCIGVDPYYLTHKAESLGYHPQVILSGRRINDSMGSYVAGRLIKLMIGKGHKIQGAAVLVLGITFKENCPDIRNSRVIDIVRELEEFGCRVDVYDPRADAADVRREYQREMLPKGALPRKAYAGIVLAVAHAEFAGVNVAGSLASDGVVYDVKSFLDRSLVDERL